MKEESIKEKTKVFNASLNFTGEGRNEALLVDLVGEWEKVTNHID